MLMALVKWHKPEALWSLKSRMFWYLPPHSPLMEAARITANLSEERHKL